MRDLSIMIKPASSACNLSCRYCFYNDVAERREEVCHAVMSQETAETILSNIFSCLDPGDYITFAFQGGEPMLAGLDYFRTFAAMAEEKNPGCHIEYQLQTNGTLLDPEWCRFLKEKAFLVGLSLDGPREIHDLARVDRSGRGTFDRVMEAKTLLEAFQVDYNVLMTLTSGMAEAPEAVWEFIRREKIPYVQFTPCMGTLEQWQAKGTPDGTCGRTSEYMLHPQQFADFYRTLFPLWLEEWTKDGRGAGDEASAGPAVVKLFDDLITLLAANVVTMCGLNGRCTTQLIVESNGDVYPCDFYALEEYKLGNLCRQTIREIYESPDQKRFHSIPHPQKHLCRTCRYLRLCGGYCKRMQPYVCYGKEDTNCGYQQFLDSAIVDMQKIARNILAENR